MKENIYDPNAGKPIKITARKLILMLILATILTVAIISQRDKAANCALVSPHDIDNIIEDGYTRTDTGARTNTSTILRAYKTVIGAVEFLSWVEWNISEIADTATIYNAKIRYSVFTGWNDSYGLNITEYNDQVTPPSDSTGNQIITDVQAGEIYYSVLNLNISSGIYTYDLGGSVIANITTALSNDWFAVGIRPVGSGRDMRLDSTEGGYDTALIVETDQGNYTFTVDGLFYENGTLGPAGNFTVYELDGTISEFEGNGSTRYVGFNSSVLFLSWDLVGGGTRRIYGTGQASEALTLYIPEDNYATYQFRIRDFTGRLGKGATYLQSYRSINGTEQLVERLLVQDSINTIPLIMVQYKTYSLVVLFYDSSTYRAGYYVSDVDPTITISIKGIQFSDSAQVTYRHLTLEATRPTRTSITVNYNDTRSETAWCNLTIAHRNGTVVYTDTTINSNHQFNYLSANEHITYTVTLQISHASYGLLGKTWLLGTTKIYTPFPKLEGLGTLGAFSGDLFSMILIIFCMAGVSDVNSELAIFVGIIIAAILTAIGGTSFTYNSLAILIGVVIMYGVIKSGRPKL